MYPQFKSESGHSEDKMILSDRDIYERLESGDLVIDPIQDIEQQVQPASFDVRLGSTLKTRKEDLAMIDPTRLGEKEVHDVHEIPEGGYAIEPDDFLLGTTIERVEIPNDLLARVQGRSSIGRLAVTVHSTAGIIDPGYRGQITLELTNEGDVPVVLREGMRIGQLTFQELKTPAERPYGDERGSKYQGQNGPTGSRIHQDRDL